MNHIFGARRASIGSILVCQKKKAGKSRPPMMTVEIVAGSRLKETMLEALSHYSITYRNYEMTYHPLTTKGSGQRSC